MKSFNSGSVVFWANGEPYPMPENSASSIDFDISIEDILESLNHFNPPRSGYDYTDLSDWENQYGR